MFFSLFIVFKSLINFCWSPRYDKSKFLSIEAIDSSKFGKNFIVSPTVFSLIFLYFVNSSSGSPIEPKDLSSQTSRTLIPSCSQRLLIYPRISMMLNFGECLSRSSIINSLSFKLANFASFFHSLGSTIKVNSKIT